MIFLGRGTCLRYGLLIASAPPARPRATADKCARPERRNVHGPARIPGKTAVRQARRARAGGPSRGHARGGARGRRGARLPRRGQGPGPDRRPRQGGRHQARQGRRRGRGARRGDPRHGHPRPDGARGLGRARLRHRGRVLRGGRLRPGRQEAARDALLGGRDGVEEVAEQPEGSRACTSTRWSASSPSTVAGSRSRAASTRT